MIVAFMLVSGLASATDDAYLKMLEGEAESIKLDQKGQLQDEDTEVHTLSKVKEAFHGTPEIMGEDLPSGLQREQFESVLKDNFYGTFLFFNKLDSADKETVYYRYTKADSTSLDNVRRNILDLLKQ
jgi:hypothetical protein